MLTPNDAESTVGQDSNLRIVYASEVTVSLRHLAYLLLTELAD